MRGKSTRCVRRLLKIASNRQLINMLLKGDAIEIILNTPQEAGRGSPLAALKASDDGRFYPVAAQVVNKSGARESESHSAADQPLVVLPGTYVVMDEAFEGGRGGSG